MLGLNRFQTGSLNRREVCFPLISACETHFNDPAMSAAPVLSQSTERTRFVALLHPSCRTSPPDMSQQSTRLVAMTPRSVLKLLMNFSPNL